MSGNTAIKVLCVDDDVNTLEMLSVLLAGYGLEVTIATNSREALQLDQLDDFDSYLLDSWLPEIDGFELCRRLRQLHRTKPIFFYSGAGAEADIARGLRAGADSYIVKPDIEDLISQLTTACQRAPLAQPGETVRNYRQPLFNRTALNTRRLGCR